MAWSTPPTFSNGEVLSATKLNQLSDCVNWLNGVGAQPAPLMLSTGSAYFYCPRHTQRYLQVRYYSSGGNDIAVKYNGGNIFHDGAPDDGENWMREAGSPTGYLDLNAVAGFVAYGQPYVIQVVVDGGTMLVRLVAETSTAAVT